MSGQLSPDGQYYWDGAKWVSLVSPDGAYRWDGGSWRSTASSPRVRGRAAALIAGSVLVALVLGGVAVIFSTRLLTSQRASLQSSLGPSCTGPTAEAGSRLAEGDLFCGTKLGVSYLSADCTQSTTLPSEVAASQVTSPSTDWSVADVGVDSGGCELAAKPNQSVEIDSTGEISPDIVLVADFVPLNHEGGVGLRLACTQSTSCIDVTVYADDSFSLDEGTANNTWRNISQGPLILTHLHVGSLNRFVLRFALDVVTVYLNGYEVTHGTPTQSQMSGPVGFYLDDQQSSAGEQAQLRTLDAFGSV